MTTKAAGLLIFRRISERIEYLLLQASYGSFHFSPPKGHVDPGENEFETAIREVKEESGYGENDLRIYKEISKTLCYKVKGHNKSVVYWLAELKDPTKEVTLSEEHQDHKWLQKNEAIKTAGYDDFAVMVEYFHDKILNM